MGSKSILKPASRTNGRGLGSIGEKKLAITFKISDEVPTIEQYLHQII